MIPNYIFAQEKKIAPHPKKKNLLNKIVSKNKLNFYCI